MTTKKQLYAQRDKAVNKLKNFMAKTNPKHVLWLEAELKKKKERIKTLEEMHIEAEKVHEHDNKTLSNFIATCDRLDTSNRQLRLTNKDLRAEVQKHQDFLKTLSGITRSRFKDGNTKIKKSTEEEDPKPE